MLIEEGSRTSEDISLVIVFFLVITRSLVHQKQQPTLSRPNVEVEYCGITSVVYESCRLHNFLLELQCLIHKTIMV